MDGKLRSIFAGNSSADLGEPDFCLSIVPRNCRPFGSATKLLPRRITGCRPHSSSPALACARARLAAPCEVRRCRLQHTSSRSRVNPGHRVQETLMDRLRQNKMPMSNIIFQRAQSRHGPISKFGSSNFRRCGRRPEQDGIQFAHPPRSDSCGTAGPVPIRIFSPPIRLRPNTSPVPV